MGYSSNYQIGQALHKEYEATYSTSNHAANTNAINVSLPVKLVSTLTVLAATVTFLAQGLMA